MSNTETISISLRKQYEKILKSKIYNVRSRWNNTWKHKNPTKEEMELFAKNNNIEEQWKKYTVLRDKREQLTSEIEEIDKQHKCLSDEVSKTINYKSYYRDDTVSSILKSAINDEKEKEMEELNQLELQLVDTIWLADATSDIKDMFEKLDSKLNSLSK